MPLVLKDRVRETSITVGTGTLTLDGAVAGFQSFAFIGNTNTTYYAIVDVNTGSWEVGLGTYTASGTTLSRDVVLESSAGGVRVNFTSNIKDVFCTYPAEQAVTLDDVQTLTNKTISSPSLTGTPIAPTAAAATNTTQVATTAHVFAERTNTATLTNKTLTSPTLTGTPSATTPARFDRSTRIATMAAVGAEQGSLAGQLAINVSQAIAASNGGSEINASGTITLTLPVGAAVPAGAAFIINNSGAGIVTVVPTGSDVLKRIDAAAGNIVLGAGDATTIVFAGGTLFNARVFVAGINAVISTAQASVNALKSNTATTTTRTAATGSSVIPAGTTAQRDATPLQGFLRYNASIASFEGYSGTSWGSVGGGATGAAGDTVFQENSRIVTASYTISAGKNASLVGPLTVNSGVQVTVPTGARLVIF